MPDLPSLTYRQVASRLKALGFVLDRQARGSREIWYNQESRRRTTVPRHTGDIPRGALRAIIGQRGVSVDAFLSAGDD